uniref:Pyridoxal phosphate phosphatase PHOSPHO2 n=1 Tax=Neovison vison TaxID=452646 RepID=A0A8C7EW31_NEOVI
MKILLVFDFDNTMIDDNSDTWIVQYAPEKKFPIELQDSYEKGFWTEFMAESLSLGDEGVREDEMKRAVTSMPFTLGMVELLKFIRKNKDKFDYWVLEATSFHDVFDKVFTNPAAFDSNGHLTVESYHAHSCNRCPQNLCKNVVLVEFVDKQLQQGVNYTQIVYIGDGGNDRTFNKPCLTPTSPGVVFILSENFTQTEESMIIVFSFVQYVSKYMFEVLIS